MQTWTMSEAGLAMTKGFEGLRLQAYQDGAGIWTVGYGHTGPDVVPGRQVSAAEAEELLRTDLREAIERVNHLVIARIQQHQFDALVDFCFNVGSGHFATSELLRKVNVGDLAGAAAQFAMWTHIAGRPVSGLIRRRAAERTLFLA